MKSKNVFHVQSLWESLIKILVENGTQRQVDRFTTMEDVKSNATALLRGYTSSPTLQVRERRPSILVTSRSLNELASYRDELRCLG